MRPSELYERKPERVDNEISHLFGCYYNHVPEIEDFQYGAYIGDDKGKRITVLYYKDFCFDGRRTWTLAAVKFDDSFVMITRNAGREGDDFHDRFITNKDKYNEMIDYIRTLLPDESKPNLSEDVVIDDDSDIKNLDYFYDNRLDGTFERYY